MRAMTCLLAFFSTSVMADVSPISTAFQVQAVVEKGCVFGSNPTSPISNLGTIDFGTVASFATNQDTLSTVGNGSIVLTCTPGISVTISLGSGLNSSDINQRFLKRTGGTEVLAYQLYQDVSHTTVWGTGSQGRFISDFPLSTQTYTVYARLLSRSAWPRAGEYVDSVVVELAY